MSGLARGAGRGGEISVFGASPFFLKDALVRTTLGVNWGLEGVADDDDDATSFQAVFILQPMKPRYIGRHCSPSIVKDCC